MTRLLIASCAAILLLAAPAFAQTDELTSIGQLLVSGRAAEARPRVVKMRDDAIQLKNDSPEAAAWLLLGMVDMSLGDSTTARTDFSHAETKYVAIGDHFGAWLSLWMRAEIENGEGHYDDSIALHERAQKLLLEAGEPSSQFSIETLLLIGQAFGTPMDTVGPVTQYPGIVKPVLLKFANILGNFGHAHVLIEAGRDLDQADQLLDQATADSAMFANMFDFQISTYRGDLRRQQWRLEEARESYLKALQSTAALPNVFKLPSIVNLAIYSKLADLESLTGRIDDALQWNDRSLTIARTVGNPNLEVQALRARADLFLRAGRYEETFRTFDSAQKIAVDHNDLHGQAATHLDLGLLCLQQGKYGTAVTHVEKAISLYQTLQEPVLESTAWMLLAEVHTLLDVQDSAEAALATARELAKKSGYKLASATVDMIEGARRVALGTGKLEDAEALLKALFEMPEAQTLLTPELEQIAREAMRANTGKSTTKVPPLGSNAPDYMRWMPLVIRGKMLLEQGDPEGARRVFLEALKFDAGRDLRAGMFGLVGVTYFFQGNIQQGIRYLKDAAKTLDASADDVKVEDLLASYLGSDRRVYYEFLIEMLVVDGRPDEAFAQAERARARAFLQLLGNHRLNGARGGDPRLADEAESLRTHLIERERELHQPGANVKAITADLERERERYKTLMMRVKASNPEYASLTTVEPLPIASIRSDIPPDTTTINYFVSPHAVHVWVIDRTDTHYVLLPVDRNALQRIVCWAGSFNSERPRGIEVGNPCGETATAEDAYARLFAPIREFVRTSKVIVIPHGPLHYVPFAALRDPDTGKYLVDKYILTYAPSASALRFLRAKESPIDGGCLILGDPNTPLPNLEKLAGARQEAEKIAALFHATAHTGADARESLLYDMKEKPDLIHLSAHGLYDGVNPLFSRIALAEGDGQDGSLTVNEILSSVDLQGVNLVVLSACRTAIGARSGGDEVVGLTRALLYAGTPGVLSTLWNINDAASASLMEEFYRGLADGLTAAEALRQAQLDIKQMEGLEDPKYWAAFTLNGDPQGVWKKKTH